MALETASTINELNASNPVVGDNVNQGANHIRLIKSTLLESFSGFTGAANVTVTEAQINSAVSAFINGVSVLSETGVTFATNTKDGFLNPAAGEVDVVASNGGSPASSVAVAKFFGSNKSAAFQGPVSAVGPITGPGSVPIGMPCLWPLNTLPSDGNWVWANGQALSRTTFAALFEEYGTTFGPGDGSTTFNVINMCEVVPMGTANMGGAAGRGLTLPTQPTANVTGAVFGSATHTLTAAEIPPVTFSGETGTESADHSHTFSAPAVAGGQTGGGAFADDNGSVTESTGGQSNAHTHAFSGAINGGGGAHNIVQPTIAMNYIIRAF
jgi:microcystin-dependent protein